MRGSCVGPHTAARCSPASPPGGIHHQASRPIIRAPFPASTTLTSMVAAQEQDADAHPTPGGKTPAPRHTAILMHGESGFQVCTSALPEHLCALPARTHPAEQLERSLGCSEVGEIEPESASTTTTRSTHGKSWPLATIWVPRRTPGAERAKVWRVARARFRHGYVESRRNMRSSGRKRRTSSSTPCVPTTARAKAAEPQTEHKGSAGQRYPQ